MENQNQVSKTRIITTTVVLLFAISIAVWLIPSDQPVTMLDILRVAVPFAIALLFFLFFDDIASLTQHLINAFVHRVAQELTTQMANFGAVMPRRSRSSRAKLTKYQYPMVLDTSAIIDGRIEYILATGFISGTFLIPEFILTELQSVADSASALKRQRGRRGLEILESIRALAGQEKGFTLQVIPDNPKRIKAIDEKLLKVAKNYRAAVVTCDYNLNKVAKVFGIRVLNVNDLVNAVKTVTLPGETITVKLIQSGKEPEQGVGYLEDGTMIVVEDGNVYLGSEVKVAIHRVIQTSAGRMLFATVVVDSEGERVEIVTPVSASSKTSN